MCTKGFFLLHSRSAKTVQFLFALLKAVVGRGKAQKSGGGEKTRFAHFSAPPLFFRELGAGTGKLFFSRCLRGRGWVGGRTQLKVEVLQKKVRVFLSSSYPLQNGGKKKKREILPNHRFHLFFRPKLRLCSPRRIHRH